jgi:hypothetical protein
MKRESWFILSFFLFLNYCGDETKSQINIKDTPDFFLVSGTDVRMRSGPGTNNRIIKTLNFGVMLESSPVDKESFPGWARVKTKDGTSGYISNDLVRGFGISEDGSESVKKLILARFDKNLFSLREFKDFLDFLRKNQSKDKGDDGFFRWFYYSHLRSVSEYLTEGQALKVLSPKDKTFFLEDEPGYVFNHKFLFQFTKDYPRSPYAEEAFWNAVNSTLEEDCENYFLCGLRNKLNHELIYLKRYPQGQFSERSLSALRDFLLSYPGLKKPEYPLSQVMASPQELIQSIDEVLLILESISNTEEQNSILIEIKESLNSAQ